VQETSPVGNELSLRRVVATWWPLAISWMLMSAEPPMLAAVVARLAHPEIHLAAYGSLTFPLVGILQAPILTLLSLSTTMSRDWESYLKGRKIMFYLGGGLTLLYIAIVFTPLYYLVVRDLIGAPPEIIEPARLGMFVGLPWSFAVAYRRFHQGVLIRFEHTRAVTVGTLLRFSMDALVLILGFVIGTIPGTMVATGMMVCGVITDAVYVGLRVRPVIQQELRRAPPILPPVTLKAMILFFIPLGITPLLNMLIRPIGSAALSRMPDPLITLAVWPVISGFSFLIVTPGAALHEVVIALLDRSGARKVLLRFMGILMLTQFTVMALLAFTPLAYDWFSVVSGLPPDLARLAANTFQILIPTSLISPLNSWLAGSILQSRKSRPVTEGMVIYLGVYVTGLLVGGAFLKISGIYIAVGSAMLASMCQTAWLWFRAPSRVLAHP
jgi:hypothetical protein